VPAVPAVPAVLAALAALAVLRPAALVGSVPAGEALDSRGQHPSSRPSYAVLLRLVSYIAQISKVREGI
jgi:hypothetical protein